MMTIGGMEIIIVPDAPKIQLRDRLMISDEFRKEFNIWLAGFFGYQSMFEDGRVMADKESNTLFMKKKTYHQMRIAIEKRERS